MVGGGAQRTRHMSAVPFPNSDLRTHCFAGGGSAADPSLSNIHPCNDPSTGFQAWFPCSTSVYHASPPSTPVSPRVSPHVANGDVRGRAAASRRISQYRDQHSPLRQRCPEHQPALPLHHIEIINSKKIHQVDSPEAGRPLPFVPVRYRARD